MKILLRDGDKFQLVLPDGREVGVELSHPFGQLLPELEIQLPQELAVNCFAEHLQPAKGLRGAAHCRLARWLTIPIEKKELRDGQTV